LRRQGPPNKSYSFSMLSTLLSPYATFDSQKPTAGVPNRPFAVIASCRCHAYPSLYSSLRHVSVTSSLSNQEVVYGSAHPNFGNSHRRLGGLVFGGWHRDAPGDGGNVPFPLRQTPR